MTLLLSLLVLAQVEPFKIESKKITPEIRKEIAKLDAIRVDAFQKACQAVGATLPEEHQVILRLVDGADPDPAKFSKHDGLAAVTSSKNDVVVEIRFHAEYFVNGLLIPEETFRHEMVHAAMRLDLRKEPYRALPRWLREGIAVHVAGQTADKLIYGFMSRGFALDPGKLIDGLEDPDHTLDDYAEDGLGVAHLIGIAGADALAKLEAELRGGRKYREAIAAVTGKPFADFLAGAQESGLAKVNEAAEKLKSELELYRGIIEKNEKSKAECDQFLKSYPKSPLRSAVLYYAAKAAGDDAVAAFDAFIKSAHEPNGYPGFIDDALIRKARLLSKKKQAGDAVAVYEHLVKWHIGSPHAITALYEWGFEVKAAPLLRRALEIDPKHRHAARAKKLLGD